MPNPFIRLGSQVQSKPAEDRPTPIPPVLEKYAGENNPYRGIESHGVAANDEPSPPGAWADNHEGFTYVEEPPMQDPIPVEIVTKYAREFRRFRIHRMSVDNTHGVQFVGRNDARTSILIQNRDAANSVFIQERPTDPNNGPAYGFELAKGEELTLFSEAPVYIVGNNAAMVTVQAIEYYSVKE